MKNTFYYIVSILKIALLVVVIFMVVVFFFIIIKYNYLPIIFILLGMVKVIFF